VTTHTAAMSFLCPYCREAGHGERGFTIRVEVPRPVIRSVRITCHRCHKSVMWHRDAQQGEWQKEA